jgi:hypothetical protein
LTANNSTGTQLFAGTVLPQQLPCMFIMKRAGNQHLFKVTIADLNSITPPSASYCSQYRLTIPYARYFTQSGTNTTGNTELAELS